ncbi:hypothetical protein GCM10017782_10770 [Deinococcus ficus]|nr:hypothetical protein GCM10017782_10770 [Deinococcus ficus]
MPAFSGAPRGARHPGLVTLPTLACYGRRTYRKGGAAMTDINTDTQTATLRGLLTAIRSDFDSTTTENAAPAAGVSRLG